MFPTVAERSWAEPSVTCVGLILNLALSVWLDCHCWSPGTTPVAATLFVLMYRWNELPAANGPKKVPPWPSPVALTKIAIPLLWQ
jgi:hypothetical protein